jgi:hypothetical protein
LVSKKSKEKKRRRREENGRERVFTCGASGVAPAWRTDAGVVVLDVAESVAETVKGAATNFAGAIDSIFPELVANAEPVSTLSISIAIVQASLCKQVHPVDE